MTTKASQQSSQQLLQKENREKQSNHKQTNGQITKRLRNQTHTGERM
jgi:hypothetical protein